MSMMTIKPTATKPFSKSLYTHSMSPISTEADILLFADIMLNSFQLAPINANLTVGFDGNIAYGYVSNTSINDAYGDLDITAVAHRTIVQLRVLTNGNVRISVDSEIPFDSIDLLYDGATTVTLTKTTERPTRYEIDDQTTADFIISKVGASIPIKLTFNK